VCDELNYLETNEDKVYKDACGGRFTTTNIETASNRVVFKTLAACSTDHFMINVILKATINFPIYYGLGWFFQYSTNPDVDCAGCLETGVTTYQQYFRASGYPYSAEWTLNNLSPGTYYYQVVVIVRDGYDTEARFCGNLIPYTVKPKATNAPTRAPTKAPTAPPVCAFPTRNTTVRFLSDKLDYSSHDIHLRRILSRGALEW